MKAVDLAVIGAGPAGAAAAVAARGHGLTVALIDEQDAPGGQVYRAPSAAYAAAAPEGTTLRTAVAASGATLLDGRRVWLAERGFHLHLIGGGAGRVDARALILATGAQERVAPIDGWTLPGVMGLAAATVLIKAEGMLPGSRVVVAGRGPLLLLVAWLIVRHGGTVAAVIDENPVTAWLAQTPGLLSRPDLMWQGASWVARLVRNGVPLHFNARLRRCLGADRVEAVEVGGGGRIATIACDAVCYGHGLAPATELSRQLGARHRFDADLGGWALATALDGAAGLPLLYGCGDGAGVLGAAAAPHRGRLAALAAAHDLGVVDTIAFGREAGSLRRKIRRAGRFGAAMTRLAPPGMHQVAQATPETIVCRCEGVTRASLDAAIEAGAATTNALKSATRCGMGPCGGRFCGESAAALIAMHTGRPLAAIAPMSGRPPIRPLPMSAVMGDFRYEDMPFPELAPL